MISTAFCQKLFLGTVLITFLIVLTNGLKGDDCEVCIKVLDKFSATLDEETKKNPKTIENQFRKYCKTSKGSENRFVSNLIFV